jgi:hypothetical protein
MSWYKDSLIEVDIFYGSELGGKSGQDKRACSQRGNNPSYATSRSIHESSEGSEFMLKGRGGGGADNRIPMPPLQTGPLQLTQIRLDTPRHLTILAGFP